MTDHSSPIRDAATLILVDHCNKTPHVYMGRRRASQVFLPNLYVFPGGRVDAADHDVVFSKTVSASSDRNPRDFDEAATPSPKHAARFMAAALRETFEETGFLVGSRQQQLERTEIKLPDEDNVTKNRNDAWAAFAENNITLDVGVLTYFARAITPPGRSRRYDTRFYLTDARNIIARVPPPDDELSDQKWFDLATAKRLDLPPITLHILDDLEAYVAKATDAAASWQVPFYHYSNGEFQRDIIAV